MKNVALSRSILDALAARGVREVILCAGARNASVVTVLSAATGVDTYSFFDERGAAFFALGRINATGRPVVVVTTSGTAVAETLPAVIEADLQRAPLIILSADRPRRYRGTGAPQTIVQPGLFSSYVEHTLDVGGTWDPDALNRWGGARPLHLNVCFDEPLLDAEVTPWTWASAPAVSAAPASCLPIVDLPSAPLILVGGLTRAESDFARPILKRWGRPLLLEATSQLRGCAELRDLELRGADPAAVEFDGVVRVGDVPTLRFWRDLEKSGLPATHFSTKPWPGLPGAHVVHPLRQMNSVPSWSNHPDLARDRAGEVKLSRLLDQFNLSEPAWVRRLSEWIPHGARVFLGNSLPIREWDLAATRQKSPWIFANRGANGIDGLISTFAGVAEAGAPNWIVLGDLSTLYDLGGPWAFRARPIADVTIAVINNGGGKIFERIFRNSLFENRHDLEFGHWARQWNLHYDRLTTAESPPPRRGPRVLEIVPDAAQTAGFWREWDLK